MLLVDTDDEESWVVQKGSEDKHEAWQGQPWQPDNNSSLFFVLFF
jgi:hypothetical protein